MGGCVGKGGVSKPVERERSREERKRLFMIGERCGVRE